MDSSENKDDMFYGDVLRSSKDTFVTELNSMPLIDVLSKNNLFGSSDWENIKKIPTQSMQNRRTLGIVIQSGKAGYDIFKDGLLESNQIDLYHYLEKKEAKLEAEIRKSLTRQEVPDSTVPAYMYQPINLGSIAAQIKKRLPTDTGGHMHTVTEGMMPALDSRDAPDSFVHTYDGDTLHIDPDEKDALSSEVDNQTSFSDKCTFGKRQTALFKRIATAQVEYQEIEKCFFDGRLIHLTEMQVEHLLNIFTIPLTSRSLNEKVYTPDDNMTQFKMRVVIKEITIRDEKEATIVRSIINDKTTTRIIHFAIVPLLAIGDSSVKMFQQPLEPVQEPVQESVYHIYFVVPYPENGDLSSAIQEDNTNVLNNKQFKMNDATRLRILYQMASAIDYLYTHVSGIRRRLVDNNTCIKSANVALDKQYNARLMDFEFARELKEADKATGGYMYLRCGHHSGIHRERYDCQDFGIIIREILTGQSPTESIEGRLLWQQTLKDLKPKIQVSIWEKPDDQEELLKLSTACINDNQHSARSSKAIKEKLKQILQKSSSRVVWKRSTLGICEMCMVNPIVDESSSMRHKRNCSCKIQICVACMRNSYLNPIMCHTCDEKVVPPVDGDALGAILIAGNDKDERIAMTFRKDVEKLKEVFVSKRIPAIGIKEDNVQVVHPTNPGRSEALLPKIESAFDNLKLKSLSTLMVVFSGHHRVENGFHLGILETDENTAEYMTKATLCDKLSELKNTVGKFIVFLDCCFAQSLEELKLESPGLCIVQLNACSFDETAVVFSGEYSIFTQAVVQAFTKEAFGRSCFNSNCSLKECKIEGDFMTIGTLLKYVDRHITDYANSPYTYSDEIRTAKSHIANAAAEDFIIAYNFHSKVEIEFTLYNTEAERMGNVSVVPITFDSVKKSLFKKYVEWSQGENTENTILQEYSDTICIGIDNGPTQEQREELDTVDKVTTAWNNMKTLRVELRHSNDIEKGRVGAFLSDARCILGILDQLIVDGLQIEKSEDEQHISLTLGGDYCCEVSKYLELGQDSGDAVSSDGHVQIATGVNRDAYLTSLRMFTSTLDCIHILNETAFIKIVFPRDVAGGSVHKTFVCIEMEKIDVKS